MILGLESAKVLVLGVGNRLLGDDGLGPAVIGWLQRHAKLPSDVLLADVGTAAREVLFDLLLSERRPKLIVIVDSIDRAGCLPGQVFVLKTKDLPPAKLSNFSVHQFPDVCLLSELEEFAGVNVTIVAAQVSESASCVRLGLSPAVALAVPKVGECVKGLVEEARR